MKRLQDKTNVIAPDATYSFGSIKDNPGDGTGTPANRDLLSDGMQLFEKLIAESGIVANGLPDNDANGYQLYEAFRKLTKPYKSYNGLLSQTGTSAPTITIDGVNEIGAIVWSYVTVGDYRATLSGAFAGSTHIFLGSGYRTGGGTYSGLTVAKKSNSNTLIVNSMNSSGTLANDVIIFLPIEIRVYD